VSVELHGQPMRVRVSLVDATNPTVFLAAEDLQPLTVIHGEQSGIDYSHPHVTSALEQIRQRGAELMGLDPSAQAQPKIAVLSRPVISDTSKLDPESESSPDIDVIIHALSMGVLHKAVPMTVGLCLGVAAGIKGTVAWEIVDMARRSGGRKDAGTMIRMEHPSGIVEVGAEFNEMGEVLSARVIRTGRRLMKGVVWW
jgi:2-methylaconitate cis-trans-isomerase PrpF